MNWLRDNIKRLYFTYWVDKNDAMGRSFTLIAAVILGVLILSVVFFGFWNLIKFIAGLMVLLYIYVKLKVWWQG